MIYYSPNSLISVNHYSNSQGILEQPPHSVDPHPLTSHISSAVAHLEQMWLDIMKTGVEHQLKVRTVRHLGHKLMLVHHLSDVHGLLAQHLPQLLPPAKPLALIGQADNLHPDSPHLTKEMFSTNTEMLDKSPPMEYSRVEMATWFFFSGKTPEKSVQTSDRTIS